MTRFLNTALLILLLALPLYGARTGVLRPVRAAQTDEEHRADLAKLAVLPRGEFLVSGQGAPRTSYGDCHRDLPAFQKLLVTKGLTSIEPPTCTASDGNDAFVPSFRATSSLELEVTSISGARYNSMSFCEIEAQRIFTDYSKRGVLALEFVCLKVPSTEITHGAEELFQPMVLLLTPPANANRAAASLEALAN